MNMSSIFSDKLTKKLQQAESFTAFTGAGMSSESGIPTFRGENGLWKKFKPEELANFDAFIRNPELVWEWYQYRRKIISSVQPNPGHYALAEMEKYFKHFTIITQNIDNLHRRAGSTNIYELHGNIERNFCVGCKKFFTDEEISQLHLETSPRCPICDGLIRPDVVWFGEALPDEQWNGSVAAAESTDILISVGTSGVVYPAASIPIIAQRAGAYIVEINPSPSELSHMFDEVIPGKAGEVLPKLQKHLEQLRKCK